MKTYLSRWQSSTSGSGIDTFPPVEISGCYSLVHSTRDCNSRDQSTSCCIGDQWCPGCPFSGLGCRSWVICVCGPGPPSWPAPSAWPFPYASVSFGPSKRFGSRTRTSVWGRVPLDWTAVMFANTSWVRRSRSPHGTGTWAPFGCRSPFKCKQLS